MKKPLPTEVESNNVRETHVPKVDLKSLINNTDIQSIMDDFYSLTHMATAILDLKGNVIEATGWQDICTKFHRAHADSSLNCTESDLYLAKNLNPGDYAEYKCKNGLWDVVTPLYVGSEHMGNIYAGQFFYDDEQVDEEYFAKQAAKYGYDKESYLEAFRCVPKYSHETISLLMGFLMKFTTYISSISRANMQLEKEIRERKRAEEALKKSEAYLSTLIRTIPDLVWLKDEDGNYLSCNTRFEKFFGAKEHDIIGKTDYDFVDKELADFFRKHDKLAMQKGEPSSNEEELIFADDGHRAIFETIKTPMYSSSGQLIGVLGVGRDITERKKIEETLRQNEIIVSSSSDMLALLDTQFRYIAANPKYLEAYNKTSEELIGHTVTEVLGEDLFNSNVKQNAEQCLSGKEVNFQTWIDFPVKGRKFVDKCYHPYIDSNNEVKGFVIKGRDVTESKQLEEERAKADRLESIGILAGGIAHDFNNILAAILGNTSIAKLKIDSNNDMFELLSETENATIRATKLTQQLLTFARGGAPIIETCELADTIIDTAEFSLRGSNVNCDTALTPDLWAAEVDKGQISQVIGNLVMNAKHSMPHGGTVKVKAENLIITATNSLSLPEGKYVKITVTDNGGGIQEQHLSRIFEPYFTSKENGTGLGLATSYSIIRRHKGRITVESQYGKGSTFHIFLPASFNKIKKDAAPDEIFKDFSGKILLMDDEYSIRQVGGMMLKSLGNEFEAVSDGEHVIESYEKAMKSGTPFDAVILDLTIPGGMGGKDAVEKLLEIDPAAKVLVSSGYSDDPVISRYREHGFCGYIPKPYKLEDLQKSLNTLLGKK
jgi:two-component system, cell cycle sensor histidine kinase and response regulator CckA